MKKKEFTEEEIKEMIRLYNEEMLGTPSIGKIFNVDKGAINRILKENNVVMGPSGRKFKGGKSIVGKRYRDKNREKLSEYHKEWSNKNRKKLREYHTEWRKDNIDHKRKRIAYDKKKCAEDPKYRLSKRTRTALWACLKEANVAKYRSTFDILGYSIEELMTHLENKFTKDMTWDNYGEWHVDHKIPMASFQFETTEDNEFKECWKLDNLQPLWGLENLVKGSKVL